MPNVYQMKVMYPKVKVDSKSRTYVEFYQKTNTIGSSMFQKLILKYTLTPTLFLNELKLETY